MKLGIVGFLLITFVIHLIPQAIVMAIVWAVNEFTGAYLPYWIPAVVLFGLWLLLLLGYLLIFLAGYKQMEKEEKDHKERMDKLAEDRKKMRNIRW